MAKRIWRERDHPRDNRGRFAERGGSNWIARVSKQFEASFGDTSAGEGGTDPRLGGRLQTGKGSLLDIAGMSKAARAKYPRRADGSKSGMAGAIRDAASAYRSKSSQGELNAETAYRQRLADRLNGLAGRVESGDTSAEEARAELGRMGRSMAGLPYKNLSNKALVDAQKALRDGERSDLGLDRPAPPGAQLPVSTRNASQRVPLKNLDKRTDQEISDMIEQRSREDTPNNRADVAQLEAEQIRRRTAPPDQADSNRRLALAGRTETGSTDSFLERLSAGAGQSRGAQSDNAPQWGTMKSAGVKNGDLVMWHGVDRAAPKEGTLARIEGNGSFYRLVDPKTGDRIATWGGVAAKGWLSKAPDTSLDTKRAGDYTGGMTTPTPDVVSPPRPFKGGTITDETPVALRPLRDQVWEANTKKEATAILRDADQALVGQLADHLGVARTRAAVVDAIRNPGQTPTATKPGPQDLTPAMQGMMDRLKRGGGSISFRLNSNSRRFASVSPSERVVLQGLERRGLVRNTGTGIDFKYELVDSSPTPITEVQVGFKLPDALDRARAAAGHGDVVAQAHSGDAVYRVRAHHIDAGANSVKTVQITRQVGNGKEVTLHTGTGGMTPAVSRQVNGLDWSAPAAAVAAHIKPKPVTGVVLPGKKVTIKGTPEGIQIRDAGATDYKGDKMYTLFDADGNEIGTLQKVSRTSAVKAPGSRIASGFRQSSEWEATLKGGTTSRERGTGYTAAQALERMPTRAQVDAARERRREQNAATTPSRSEVTSAVNTGDRTSYADALKRLELFRNEGDNIPPLPDRNAEIARREQRYQQIQPLMKQAEQALRRENPGLSENEYAVLETFTGLTSHENKTLARNENLSLAAWGALTPKQRDDYESYLQDVHASDEYYGADANATLRRIAQLKGQQARGGVPSTQRTPPPPAPVRVSADELSAAINQTTKDAIRADAAKWDNADLFNAYGPEVKQRAQKLLDNWMKGLLTDDEFRREMQVERDRAQAGKA